MADSTPRKFTRRNFIGWQIAVLLTSTVVIGLAPILVFLWPAPPKGQKKTVLTVSLPTPVDQLTTGQAIKFDAPTSPNSAFILSHAGTDNTPAEPPSHGLLTLL